MPLFRLVIRLVFVGLLGALALSAPARAEGYLVEGVAGQAMAADPLAARDAATSKAQRDALEMLLKRLAAPGTEGRLPTVTDQLVFKTMQGFEVQQEKTTATSYSAVFTVEFRREAIDRLLANAGVDYVEAAGKPVVVVPLLIGSDGIARLWEDDNGWRQAWDRRPAGNDPLRMVIPLGDLPDLQTLTAQAAQQGDGGALAVLAARYEADGSIVATVQQSGAGITVTAADPGQPPFFTSTYPVGADPAAAYDKAVTAVANAIQNRYRTLNAVPAGPVVSLEAKALFTDLRGWRDLKAAIEGTAAVKKVSVRRLVVGEATIAIEYQGDPGSLREALAQRGIALENTTTGWQVRAGLPSTTAVPYTPATPGQAPVTLSPLPGSGAPGGNAPPDLLFE
ncbi:DUF2066 domain-containing protein [Oleomonas cavernae]|nr:DUF2066 domain-containing protein [Oleomonas cavernae]